MRHPKRLVVTLLLVSPIACGDDSGGGGESTEESSTGNASTETTSGSESTGPDLLYCVSQDLGSEVPLMTTISSSGMDELESMSCPPDQYLSGPEAAVVWTAPSLGTYAVSITGDPEVLLYVRRGECDGAEESFCGTGPAVSLNYDLEADESIVIVAEGCNPDCELRILPF